MKQRFLKILIFFGAVNVIGIFVFYGWVARSQVLIPRHHTHFITKHDLGSHSFLQRYLQTTLNHHDNVSKLHQEKTVLNDALSKQDPIPPVPQVSESDDILELPEAVMWKYRKYPPRPENETILILTPIHNVAGQLGRFLRLLQSINYPHSLISIAFGEDGSEDDTLHVADAVADKLKLSFSSVKVFHFNLSWQVTGSWGIVHSRGNQLHRRAHLAQARNLLLDAGLKDQDWVLWIDSDITFFSPDIIQQLLSAEKEIVTPLCIYKDGRRKRVFDKNTWRETDQSRRHLKHLPSDHLVVEGYEDTKRLWLSDLRAEGRVVPIDGVGGCTLLVKAVCHKKGLIFPEKLFQNHIETEGLAKLAKHMGFGVYGMPFVEVVH